MEINSYYTESDSFITPRMGLNILCRYKGVFL
jgi:hypothetical protein